MSRRGTPASDSDDDNTEASSIAAQRPLRTCNRAPGETAAEHGEAVIRAKFVALIAFRPEADHAAIYERRDRELEALSATLREEERERTALAARGKQRILDLERRRSRPTPAGPKPSHKRAAPERVSSDEADKAILANQHSNRVLVLSCASHDA